MFRYAWIGAILLVACSTLAGEKVAEETKPVAEKDQEVSVWLLGTIVPLYPSLAAEGELDAPLILREQNAVAVLEVVNEAGVHRNASVDMILAIVPTQESVGLWRGTADRGKVVDVRGTWNKRTQQVLVDSFSITEAVDWKDVTIEVGTITNQQEL